MTAPRAFIAGCEGHVLSPDEAAFLREAAPWGVILFGRNIETPDQVRRLTGEIREALGAEAPIFTDQEGGRVQRLRPPHWAGHASAATFAALDAADPERALRAATLSHHLMALELIDVGIDAPCAPVLDVIQPGADPVIGDRAFGGEPARVSALGAAALAGLARGGCLGVVKHMPGHGRADADSHIRLPRVTAALDDLTASDFAPFRALAHAPMAMTAHVVYAAVDEDRPATTSKPVIDTVIRGLIGFDGLLMCDDLSMQALSGDLRQRTRDAIAAGCDVVLHGNGMLQGERLAGGAALRAELEAVAGEAPVLSDRAKQRADAALAQRRTSVGLDVSAARAELKALMESDDRILV